MRLTFDHIEDKIAVLRTEQGEALRVPRSELPDEIEEGDTIDLQFHFTGTTSEPKDDTNNTNARSVLNELLNTPSKNGEDV